MILFFYSIYLYLILINLNKFIYKGLILYNQLLNNEN